MAEDTVPKDRSWTKRILILYADIWSMKYRVFDDGIPNAHYI
jgi:hypothetical protein